MQFLKTCFVLMLSAGIIFTSVPSLYADEASEIILRLLVKKGIITQQDVDEIKKEVAKEEPMVPEGLEDRIAKLEKDTPKWLKDFKLKGDLRLRNDYEDSEPGKNNNQQRIRFRLGATTKVNDKVDLGFGLATGGSSATSTNQTLEGSFTTKDFDLDYAYIKYKPFDEIQLIGGKFKSPFFHTDMLWDSDLRFEGFAANAKTEIDIANNEGSEPIELYATVGYFPLDDMTGPRDISLVAGQVGSVSKFRDDVILKTGVAYYNFFSIEGATTLASGVTTNTYDSTALRHDFRVISPTVKLEFPKLGGLLGEYAENTGASDDNEAWRAGAWLGKAKVKKKGQWRLLGQYSEVETDSFVDIFPDGDFNDAGTNAKGWEAIFDYGLADNVILSFDYYNTEVITGTQSDDQKIQADLIFKF